MTPAEDAVARYCRAWQAGKLEQVAEHVQLTWLHEARRHAEEGPWSIRQLLPRLLGFKVIGEREADVLNPDVIVDVEVELRLAKAGIVRRLFRVICEREPYETDPEGSWGVNPTSTLRVAKEEEDDGE